MEFKRELESAVENRRAAGNLAVVHGQTCAAPGCCSLWNEYVLLDQSVAAWRTSVPEVHLQREVLRKLADERRPQPLPKPAANLSSRHVRGAALAPIAFTVGGVAVLLLGMLLNLHVPSRHEIVARLAKPGKQSPPPSQLAAEDRAIRDVSAQCVGWVDGATTRLSDAVTYVISPASAPGDAMPPDNMPADWLKIWSERLQPLEESLDRTFRSILDDTSVRRAHVSSRTS